MRTEVVVWKGINSMSQADEPTTVGIPGCALGGDPEPLKLRQAKGSSTGKVRLQVFDYLVTRISIHGLNIAHKLIFSGRLYRWPAGKLASRVIFSGISNHWSGDARLESIKQPLAGSVIPVRDFCGKPLQIVRHCWASVAASAIF
ncbi:hypothetical protein D9M69_595900 [compost metagenome]